MKKFRVSLMRHKMSIMSVVSGYAEIIDMLSSIVDIMKNANSQLIDLLHQYVTAEELDNLECIKEINKAAAIREVVDRKKEEMGCAP